MPTEIEILIHEHLMGECVHPGFTLKEERRWGTTLTLVACTECGATALADGPLGSHLQATDGDLLHCLKATIPRHCADLAMVRQVLRHLEAQGWHWTERGYDGLLEFTLARGDHKVRGEPARLEHDAVVNVISKLARELATA